MLPIVYYQLPGSDLGIFDIGRGCAEWTNQKRCRSCGTSCFKGVKRWKPISTRRVAIHFEGISKSKVEALIRETTSKLPKSRQRKGHLAVFFKYFSSKRPFIGLIHVPTKTPMWGWGFETILEDCPSSV